MIEAMIVWMAVSVMPGTAEARPFLRLKNGEYCEFFTQICMIRAENDYGVEKIDELRSTVLDNARLQRNGSVPATIGDPGNTPQNN